MLKVRVLLPSTGQKLITMAFSEKFGLYLKQKGALLYNHTAACGKVHVHAHTHTHTSSFLVQLGLEKSLNLDMGGVNCWKISH